MARAAVATALDYSSCDELTLVHRAKEGDERAFTELYIRNNTRVLSICLRTTSNAQIAPDIVNETFFKAWRKISTFHERSTFSTWVTRIAINESLMWLRDWRRHFMHEQSLDQFLSLEPDEPEKYKSELAVDDVQLNSYPERELVHQALTRMPDKMRSVILLRFFDDYNNEELGQAFGISSSAAKSHLSRAKTRMRHVLKQILCNQ